MRDEDLQETEQLAMKHLSVEEVAARCDLRSGHAGRRKREMGRNSDPLEFTGVGCPGFVGYWHDAAHVDDAPWRGNKSDRAPPARTTARSNSGFCFLPRNLGADPNRRLRARVGRGIADQIRSIAGPERPAT